MSFAEALLQPTIGETIFRTLLERGDLGSALSFSLVCKDVRAVGRDLISAAEQRERLQYLQTVLGMTLLAHDYGAGGLRFDRLVQLLGGDPKPLEEAPDAVLRGIFRSALSAEQLWKIELVRRAASAGLFVPARWPCRHRIRPEDLAQAAFQLIARDLLCQSLLEEALPFEEVAIEWRSTANQPAAPRGTSRVSAAPGAALATNDVFEEIGNTIWCLRVRMLREFDLADPAQMFNRPIYADIANIEAASAEGRLARIVVCLRLPRCGGADQPRQAAT